MSTLRRSLLGLALVAAFASAEPPAAEEKPGRFLLDGEFFLWAPRRSNQDYVISGDRPLGTPVGTIRSLEGGHDAGFRVSAGYRLESGLEASFGYTHWHASADEERRAGEGGRLFPTLTHPAFVTEVGFARASNSVNLNVFDVEFARRMAAGEGTQLRAFFGPRFANLDQKLSATYEGVDVVSDTVRRKTTFDGGGLRVGGDATFELMEHLGVVLRGSASLLTGRFRSSLDETGNGTAVVSVIDKFDKIVPTADLGFGVTYQRGGMRLSVGYEFHNWFGVIEGIDFADDAQTSKVTRRTGDLGFDGVFFRAEWAF